MKQQKALTIKTLTKTNAWELQENDIFRLWDAAEKDFDYQIMHDIILILSKVHSKSKR